jgi:hypothetical protein
MRVEISHLPIPCPDVAHQVRTARSTPLCLKAAIGFKAVTSAWHYPRVLIFLPRGRVVLQWRQRVKRRLLERFAEAQGHGCQVGGGA